MEEFNVTEQRQLERLEESDLCFAPLPSVIEFYAGFSYINYVILVIPVIFLLLTLILFSKNIKNILQNTPKAFVTKSIILCSIYPIVSSSSLLSILIPKAFFLCDTISHLTFMFCAYQLFCLCILYTKGESNFIKNADTESFSYRTPPCCCCLVWLNRTSVTKKKFRLLRLLILQMPIIHTIVFVALNIIYIEDVEIFQDIFIFFVPVIAGSIICGVWGLNMLVRMIAPYYADFRLMGKYFALQLVLILCKLQPVLLQSILKIYIRYCPPPFSLSLQINTFIQLLIMLEMLLLSIWAVSLYKNPFRK